MDQTDWTARSSGVRRTLAESDLVGVVTMTRPRATRGGSGCRIIGVRRRRFWPRLELARRVLVAARVRVLRVSGDHRNWGCDEPDAMWTWLIERGVPERRIVRGYAGFDTSDSCARAVRIFGVRRAIVVTQTYHLPAAVTLCRRLGLDADGVGDDTVRRFTTRG